MIPALYFFTSMLSITTKFRKEEEYRKKKTSILVMDLLLRKLQTIRLFVNLKLKSPAVNFHSIVDEFRNSCFTLQNKTRLLRNRQAVSSLYRRTKVNKV